MHKILSIVGLAVILSVVAMGYADPLSGPIDTGHQFLQSPADSAVVNFNFNTNNQIDKCFVSLDKSIAAPASDKLPGFIECKLSNDSGDVIAKGVLSLPSGYTANDFVTVQINPSEVPDIQEVHDVRIVVSGPHVALSQTPTTTEEMAVNFDINTDTNEVKACLIELNRDLAKDTMILCELTGDGGTDEFGNPSPGSVIASRTYILPTAKSAFDIIRVDFLTTVPVWNVHDFRVTVTPPTADNTCNNMNATIFKEATSILDNTWVVNGKPVEFQRWDKNGNGSFEDTEGWIVLGTNRDDVIVGSDLADRIEGMGGNDSICGRGGDDFLRGEGGDDIIFGEDGNDLIRGEGGVNVMDGGNGDDELHGHGKNDTIFGGKGKDTIFSYGGDDFIDCGNDEVTPEPIDFADGGGGVDTAVNCEITVNIP